MTPESGPVGLCEHCRHARRVLARRAATFWRCGRALHDPRFPKYPPLPVVVCPGFEARDAAGGDGRQGSQR